jgi:outer membrane biosynthesis protein TonB
MKLTTPMLGMTGWKSLAREGPAALVSPTPTPLPPRPIVCPSPFVPNAAGAACVCREGFEQRGNTCVDDRDQAVGGALAQPPEKPGPQPLPVAPAPQPAPQVQPDIQRVIRERAPQPQPETRRAAQPPSAKVRQAGVLLPDLRILNALVDPSKPKEVKVRVANTGQGASAATGARVWVLPQGKAWYGLVPPLAAGQDTWTTVQADMPVLAAQKVYARVDDPDKVEESNEGNNGYELK